jgi:hypothetical protein
VCFFFCFLLSHLFLLVSNFCLSVSSISFVNSFCLFEISHLNDVTFVLTFPFNTGSFSDAKPAAPKKAAEPKAAAPASSGSNAAASASQGEASGQITQVLPVFV